MVKAGGMEGYEQLCRVTGTVAGTPCDGLGQRGHSWGNPDWDKIALTRSVGAWFADGTGVALSTVRSTKASNHADEARWGASFDREGALQIDEVRLSTTSDDEQRQIRAGLELYLTKDDDYPLRGVGEVVTGSTLELGALRLDVAFFQLAHRRPHRGRPLRRPPARVIRAIVSDFGGVLTLPLNEAFVRAHDELGIPVDALGRAMRHAEERDGERPIFRLERGQITEPEFMETLAGEPRGGARARRRPRRLRRAADARAHPERAAAGLLPRRCATAASGWRSAPTTCANGSPAGAPRRSTRCSSWSSTRASRAPASPSRRSTRSCSQRLALPASECVFVDDLEINVEGAREVGMHGVHFRDTAAGRRTEIEALVLAA